MTSEEIKKLQSGWATSAFEFILMEIALQLAIVNERQAAIDKNNGYLPG
jgi:hypothetical protein